MFRLCERSFAPINFPIKHFTVENFAHWFDYDRTSQENNSTLVVNPSDVIHHGYEGIPIEEESR